MKRTMRNTCILAISLIVLPLYSFTTLAASKCEANEKYTLLIHGGFLDRESRVTPEQRELLLKVVRNGQAELAQGGHALDVVVSTIVAMEDSGLLDAGKGSIVNTNGDTETDASIMDGRTGDSGAVAAMQRLKNPIKAARLVMDKTPHVLFAGTTGEKTLVSLGAEVVNPDTYFNKPMVQKSIQIQERQKHGTVGSVVLDRCGHLAAGTSTGGWPGKLPGRIGDSPIIGASTFANQNFALSATGQGEYFIKRGATRDIVARVEYLNVLLQEAADYVVKELIGKEDHAAGAIIAITKDGEIVLSSNGYGILYGYASDTTSVKVGTKLD